MFANRFTILVDACSLVSSLKRDLLLSLTQAEFFRIRWSEKIPEEMERAVAGILSTRGLANPYERAKHARGQMHLAFPEACVTDYEVLADGLRDLPDPNDAHVIAAAVKTKASVIVTENLRDFPSRILTPLDLEAKTADDFISDTMDLDKAKAIPVIRRMRERLRRPEKTPGALLLNMEAIGLTQTVDSLREYEASL